MTKKTFFKFLLLAPLAIVWQAAAEENETQKEDDGPITVLDQTVPVAEESSVDESPEIVGPPDPSVDAPSDYEQMMIDFERYRDLKDRGIYDEAENVAKRVVELSIRVNGPNSIDTAKALNNLAIVQHKNANLDAAQQNFSSAIEIIRENDDNLSAALINPLKGLGASQLSSGRPDLAARTFQQAVHISHVNEGPHNLDQVDMLETMAEARLRMGELKAAKDTQDMIYALNIRHHSGSAVDLIPSLMRRAHWQRRTGYTLDERATYRRIIRIVESENGKKDVGLIRPLMKLGESYFYPDASDTTSYSVTSSASGEMYYKRAVRIAEENPDSGWELMARTKLGLGDYYTFRADPGRARKAYVDAWEVLSEDEERAPLRHVELEQVNLLNEEPIPKFVGGATEQDVRNASDELREGRIVVSFDVNTRGRVSKLRIVEENPADFEDIRRFLTREFRSRVFRPRFEEASPVRSENQVFTHTYYYRQDELDRMRAAASDDDDES